MERTKVAVLGTLAEFHREPIPYDLAGLVNLVADLGPDLLCLEITRDQWQRRDFSDLSAEYREALVPLAHQTDIVVVPIAGEDPPLEPVATGWRGKMINLFRRWLATVQYTMSSPDAANQGWRHEIANLLYYLIAVVAGGTALEEWQTYREYLIKQVLEMVQRDPGRRVLVVVNLRHCHHIRPILRKRSEVEVVPYTRL